MRIAVTHKNGQVFQHFGHTEQFKIYDAQLDEIVNAVVVPTNGSGHGALAKFLKDLDVDILICGGIGAGARDALNGARINVYGGVTGSCDQAVRDLLDNKLIFNPHANCTHHDQQHDHDCGGNCSSGGCGHNCGGCH